MESDISPEDLEQLYDQIDAEIAQDGYPSDEDLSAEIERLNETGRQNAQRSVTLTLVKWPEADDK